MRIYRKLRSVSGRRGVLAALCLGTVLGITAGVRLAPARGGSSEFVVVAHGMAPNGKFSIAGHSDGATGFDKDSLYLMAEPGHRKIGPLQEAPIGVNTEANAYGAIWTKDSRHVAVTYETNHFAHVMVYRVQNGRAYPVTGPTAWDEAISQSRAPRAFFKSADPVRSYRILTWLTPTRFRLMEASYFEAAEPMLGSALGKFGKGTLQEDAPSPNHRYEIQFSAVAICELIPGDKYRIVHLQPGAFE